MALLSGGSNCLRIVTIIFNFIVFVSLNVYCLFHSILSIYIWMRILSNVAAVQGYYFY